MDKGQLLVSIAMCTYNGEKYLAEQIDSILNQSHTDLEIIICDDGSSDETPEILKQYSQKDSRIKIFTNSANLGYNKNFEKAISLASGNYIAISDQDDIWARDKIDQLLKNIGDNWLIFSNSSLIDTAGNDLKGTLLNRCSLTGTDYRSLLLANFITGHTTLFTREFIDRVLPFPPVSFYDWYMGFVAAYHRKLIYLDKCLTKYRIHTHSVIQKSLSDKDFKAKQFHSENLQRDAFISYKNIEEKDRQYIARVQSAYLQKEFRFAAELFQIIRKDYPVLFPFRRKRIGLRRIKFAYKYCRRLK